MIAAFLLLPAVLQEAPAAAQTTELAQRLGALEARLEKARSESHIAGCAIAIVWKDELIYSKGFGLANVEKGEPVTAETIFAIGSSTKAFTATLVGMLVDEEKLAWDAPVTQYLPDFRLPVRTSDKAAQVTLVDLLAHRTGFSRGDLLWAGGTASAKEILATVIRAEPWTDFRKEFHYNNIMFLAAGEALAAVSGKSWAELVRERLLEPLGMKSSTVSISQAQQDPRLALGYNWDEDAKKFEHAPMRKIDNVAPAGAINSNVLDMAQWVRFQLARGEIDGKRLISKEAHEQTWLPHNVISGDDAYGLGWFLHKTHGRRVVEHGGNIDGFAAQVGLLPEEELGYVLLCNVSGTPLQQGSLSLVWSALLDETEEAAAKSSDYSPYLGNYVANFASFKDTVFKVLEQDGKLAVDVPGQMVYTLKAPNAEGRWYFEISDAIAVAFARDPEGKVVGLEMYQSGLKFELPREGVEVAAEIDLDEARRFLGKYKHPLLEGDLTVLIQNNRLAVDVPKQMICELHVPDAEGKRYFRVNPAVAVRFEEDEQGVVRSLTFFERGTTHACPRSEASADVEELLSVAGLHELRQADARKRALEALGSVRISGKVRMVHAGIEGSMHVLATGLARYRSTLELDPFALIESCYVDGYGATKTSLSPFDELSGKGLEKARIDSPLLPFSDWREAYAKLVVLRADKLEERQVWVVRAEAAEELSVSYWVDAETGDVLREDSGLLLQNNMGTLPRTTLYSDYREVEGLRMAFRLEYSDEASGKTTFEITEVARVPAWKDEDLRLR